MSWQPIETAPKDGKVILFWPDGHILIGRWDDEKWNQKPSPYFDGHWRGKLWMKRNQPTHWMPLPAPPEPAP